VVIRRALLEQAAEMIGGLVRLEVESFQQLVEEGEDLGPLLRSEERAVDRRRRTARIRGG
jgi:hypothetical protein